jgi:Ser/Thr protein kinase RdoA (MazF antagonist)
VNGSDIPGWLPAHLEDRYGIRVTGLALPQAHNPFVLRVDREGGPSWVARVFGPARPVERVRGDAEILRMLEDRDHPAERCAVDDPVSTHDDRAIVVTEFVTGRAPTVSPRALCELGSLLGRLHALDDLTGAALRGAGSWHGDPAHEGLPSEDINGALAMLDEVSDRVAGPHRRRFDDLRDEVANADPCDDLPRALIHPDPGPVNAITAEGGAVFVDWTGAGSGPRAVSLGLLMFAALRQPRGWDPPTVDAIVGGYREHCTLERDELDRLGAAMRIRALYWPCYYYRMSAQSGYTPTGTEGWWPDHDAITAIADHARDAFINR